jgi:RNA polymerase sigma-70 factor (ECF subfamily)
MTLTQALPKENNDTGDYTSSAPSLSLLLVAKRASAKRLESATLMADKINPGSLCSEPNTVVSSLNYLSLPEEEQSALKTESLSDQQLVERVQHGDKRAFDLLVIKYQGKVASLVGRYVHDLDEVKDVVQETFVKAYRALPNFRGERAFYTWLYRIGVNTAKNYLVSRGRRPPAEDVPAEDAPYVGYQSLNNTDSPEKNLSRDQLEGAIYEGIQALPEDLRGALCLREFDGLSYEEIAEVMDCPVGTVRSRIFRAREAVDKHIAPYLEAISE